MARVHILAIEEAHRVKFGLYVVSAPTPFTKDQTARLKQDAVSVIGEIFPEAHSLFKAKGWALPATIGRVYDGTRISRHLAFDYQTTFKDVLDAVRRGREPPIDHDPNFTSPLAEAT